MASQLAAFVGWYFLPQMIAGFVQNVFYTITIRAGDPKPPPGSPRYVRDHRRIRIAIIAIYLIYNLYAAHHEIQQSVDFYRLLGVPLDVTDRVLQARFRRLVMSYHPDKVPAGTDRAAAEALYVRLQLARDILSDPVKRFAYDRLGPKASLLAPSTSNSLAAAARTPADHIWPALRGIGVFYAASAIGLVLPVALGYLREGTFWRYWALAALGVFEASVVLRPTWPAVLTSVVNPALVTTGIAEVGGGYLPFQLVEVLRSVALSVLLAGSQLAGLLRMAPKGGAAGAEVAQATLDRMDGVALATEQEISRLMGFEVTPFLKAASAEDGSGQVDAAKTVAMPELQTGLKEWLVQNTLRNDKDLRAAIGAALEKRR